MKVRSRALLSSTNRYPRIGRRSFALLIASLLGLTNTQVVGAASVTLAWTPPADTSQIDGYRVHYGTAPGQTSDQTTGQYFDVGKIAEAAVPIPTEGSTYYFAVKSCGGQNCSPSSVYSNEVWTAIPTAAPSVPANLSATAASASQIKLSWTASTDNVAVTGYRVERCQGLNCSNFAQIASTTGTGTSYNDTGLTASTSYRYRVRAADAAANLGGYSPIATATTLAPPDTTAPTVPGGLLATGAGMSQVNLIWTASTDNVGVTGYRVERSQAGCTSFNEIASVNQANYGDSGLASGTAYCYRVRAADAAGNLSAYSSTATANTTAPPDTTPPSIPGGLTATAAGTSQINLSWTASTDNRGVTAYRVERCKGAGCGSFASIGTVASTGYTDGGLVADTNYTYRLRAVDAAGNLSGYSNTSTAKTDKETIASAPLEYGEVSVGQLVKRVEFQKEYVDPIVVARPLGGDGIDLDPAVVRIEGVDAQGFSMRVQEWDYLDGVRAEPEKVAYLVMERGRHELPDGTWVEAGRVKTNKTNAFVTVPFQAPFIEPPLVLTSTTSNFEKDAVTSRVRQIGTATFQVGMREQESKTQKHLAENIDYIAWEVVAGNNVGELDGYRYQVGRTANAVTDRTYTLVYPSAFTVPPVLIADMQTTNGGDTAALRWKNKDEAAVELWIQEERSKDSETTHGKEVVGYLLIEAAE